MLELNIIPKPSLINIDNDKKFILDKFDFPKNYNKILQDLNKFSSKNFNIEFKENNKSKIKFEIDKSLQDEYYELNIDEKEINIKGKDEKALFYGVQSLKQLLVQFNESNKFILPCVQIKDKPKFSYRGYMFDVARHFFNKEVIFEMLDLIALYKYNIFHFHLTEDQGFRLEIDSYPNLHKIGSKRSETMEDGKPYEGYFTKKEIKEIVEYASSKYINIIPEIDMPGHSMAMLAAYPEFSCNGKNENVATAWGIMPKILCAGKDKVFDFLEKVLDEVIELFPYDYIHLGGDEVPKDEWNVCEDCQKRIKEEKLNNSEELQGYFTNRIIKYLKSKGKKAIVWNESLYSGMLDKDAICQFWAGKEDILHKEIKSGRKVIMSRFTPIYLDYPHCLHSLKAVYDHNPIPKECENNADQIIGIETPLWTEYVPNTDVAYKMILPRLIACSENVWCDKSSKNYKNFTKRLKMHYEILDKLGLPYEKLSDANPKIIKKAIQSIKYLSQKKKNDQIKNRYLQNLKNKK